MRKDKLKYALLGTIFLVWIIIILNEVTAATLGVNNIDEKAPVLWSINQTGTEAYLDVRLENLDDYTTSVCLKAPDIELYKTTLSLESRDVSALPITKLEGEELFNLGGSTLDLSKLTDNEEKCFLIAYDKLEPGMIFKIGWNSITIKSYTGGSSDADFYTGISSGTRKTLFFAYNNTNDTQINILSIQMANAVHIPDLYAFWGILVNETAGNPDLTKNYGCNSTPIDGQSIVGTEWINLTFTCALNYSAGASAWFGIWNNLTAGSATQYIMVKNTNAITWSSVKWYSGGGYTDYPAYDGNQIIYGTDPYAPGPPPAGGNTSNFTVFCKDYYNTTEVISNCNATINGTDYGTITGTIESTTPAGAGVFIDVNVTAPGYYNRSYYVNCSFNLTAYLWESIFNVFGYEAVTGNAVSSFDMNLTPIGNGSETTTATGEINVYVNANNFTLELASPATNFLNFYMLRDAYALLNDTFNATFFNVNLTINLSNRYNTSIPVSDFNLSLNALNYSYTIPYTGQNHNLTLRLLNGTYNFTFWAPGYANTSIIQNLSNGSYTLNMYLYTNNSLNFTFIDLDTNDLYTDKVNLTLSGTTVTYRYNDIFNGTYFAENLNSDTYTVYAYYENDDGERINEVLYQTVGQSSHDDLTFYMNKNKGPVIFYTVDKVTGDAVSNVILTFQQLINGSYQTVAQATTDFSGSTLVYLDETVSYYFTAVNPAYNTYTGNVTPILNAYNVELSGDVVDIYVSIFDLITLNSFCNYSINSSWATINFSVISLTTSAVIEYYGINVTYNGTNFEVNISGAPTGGETSLNITNMNVTIDNELEATLFFKAENFSYYYWSVTCWLSDYETGDTSFTGGLWSNITLSEAGRALLAIFLTLIIVMAFAGMSRNITVGAIAGILAIAGFITVDMLNLTYGSISIIVLIIFIIGDNAGKV